MAGRRAVDWRNTLPGSKLVTMPYGGGLVGADLALHMRALTGIACNPNVGAVLLIGSWLRLDRDSYTWRSGSSQLLSSRGMRWGSNLFHVGVLAILAGHFVGLLTPHFIYEPIISLSLIHI